MAANSSSSQSPIVKIALIGIALMGIFMLNNGLQVTKSKIEALPVEGATPVADVNASAQAPATFSAVIPPVKVVVDPSNSVKSSVSKDTPTDYSSVNVVFNSGIPVAEIAPSTPSVPDETVNAFIPQVPLNVPLKSAIEGSSLDATSGTGAIINGSFVLLNEEIPTIQYFVKGKVKHPILASVSTTSVEIKGDSTVTLKLK